MSVRVNIDSKFNDRGVREAQTSLQSFGKKAGAAVAGVAASFAAIGVGMAVRGIVDFTRSAVDSASDITEATNAINVAFDDAAGAIEKIGETSAQNLGLAKVEFFGAATQFSAFAKTIAGDGGDVAGVIGDITTRGADFASVFNLEVSEALRLFQSGLAGETEPLRRFGIDLSAAAVEAYALEAGIIEVGETMTEQDKILARYQTLLEQTEITAGDFANTSDSLANRQRILNASMEDLRGEVGMALLPAMEDLYAVAQEDLLPVLQTLGETAGPILADVLSTIADIAEEEVVPALEDFGNWLRSDEGVEAVEDFADGLKEMTVGFGNLVGGVIDFATHPATKAVIDFFAGLRDFFASAAFRVLFPTLSDQMRRTGEIAGFAREEYLNHASALYGSSDAAGVAAPAVEGLTIEMIKNSDSVRINNDLIISNASLMEAQQRHIQAVRMGKQHYTGTLMDMIEQVMAENRNIAMGIDRYADYTTAVSSASTALSDAATTTSSVSSANSELASSYDTTTVAIRNTTKALSDLSLAQQLEFGAVAVESAGGQVFSPAEPGATNELRAIEATIRERVGTQAVDRILKETFGGTAEEIRNTLSRSTTLVNPETNRRVVGNIQGARLDELIAQGFTEVGKIAVDKDDLTDAIKQVSDDILGGNIPGLAKGGIVTSPTMAFIGERGPEAVIPLSKLDRMKGGNTYIINVNASNRTGGSQAGEEIVAALKGYNSTNGDFNRQLTGFGA